MLPVKIFRLMFAALLYCASQAQADGLLFFWLPENGNSDYMQRRYDEYERGNANREVERLRDSLGIIDQDGQRYAHPDSNTNRAIEDQWRREGYELLFDERGHLPGTNIGPDYRGNE